MRLLALVLLLFSAGLPSARATDELPIFDAHMHYSHDAWSVVPPQDVVQILKKAGIKRAMVSSSNNEGTKMLQDVAPDLIIPELRPYRSRGEISTWAKDPTLIPYLEELLSKRRYRAIGEFHIYGAEPTCPTCVAWSNSRNSTGSSCIRIPTRMR